jgi:hypothetical protein
MLDKTFAALELATLRVHLFVTVFSLPSSCPMESLRARRLPNDVAEGTAGFKVSSVELVTEGVVEVGIAS